MDIALNRNWVRTYTTCKVMWTPMIMVLVESEPGRGRGLDPDMLDQIRTRSQN